MKQPETRKHAKRGELAKLILAAVTTAGRNGLTPPELADIVCVSHIEIGVACTNMTRVPRPQVIVIGQRRHQTQRGGKAYRVFALPGTPPLVEPKPKTREPVEKGPYAIAGKIEVGRGSNWAARGGPW